MIEGLWRVLLEGFDMLSYKLAIGYVAVAG